MKELHHKIPTRKQNENTVRSIKLSHSSKYISVIIPRETERENKKQRENTKFGDISYCKDKAINTPTAKIT